MTKLKEKSAELKELKKTTWIMIAIHVVFFLFFLLITHWTPASGDDWVYAVGGRWNNPFVQAFHMYQTWSGRYLSELWGFLVAPHKRLWNVLNPLFFTAILFLLVFVSRRRGHDVMRTALAGFLMLSVSNHLRMQTYTWIMGTTYVLPLVLFLIQTVLLRWILLENRQIRFGLPILCILNLCIPLYMENAAALMLGSDLLVLLWLFFSDRRKLKPMAAVTVFALAGTLIILLSPGAALRMSGDNAAFGALSLTQKIAQNWPLFLEHAFTEHAWITGFVFFSFGLSYYQNRKRIGWIGWAMIALLAMGIVLQNGGLDLFLCIDIVLMTLAYEEDRKKKWFLIWMLLCALGADLVMLVSPIFDSRSGLYTVYLLILAALYNTDDLDLNKAGTAAAAVLFLAGMTFRMAGLYEIYHMVHLINVKRYSEIEYYRVRPDAGDAWLLAYPDESIHSANVQEGDDTHMYYFKEYYDLNQDLHLIFYYLEDYNATTIFGE
ncbi:MAG: hypothetical protein IKD66_11505 [Solobacterium sp.]|nr:hypothetical protein [Solobacterium sp.]